jgi:Na+/pantothenate symporter
MSMNPMKLIQYIYFLNIGGVAAGVYLVVLYIILGQADKSANQAAHTAMQLAVTLWFRKRFDLWP